MPSQLLNTCATPCRASRAKSSGVQECPVPDLHPIAPARRQPAEELVQCRHELAPVGKVLPPEARELEDQQPDLRPVRRAWPQELRLEAGGIEEVLVQHTGARPRAGHVGKALHGDQVRHLEGELEIRRHLGEEALEKAGVGELVVRGIHAHRLEHLGVFGQAKPLKARLGKPPLPHVTVLGVKLPQPARILPRRRAQEYALRGKPSQDSLHVVAVKGHALRWLLPSSLFPPCSFLQPVGLGLLRACSAITARNCAPKSLARFGPTCGMRANSSASCG